MSRKPSRWRVHIASPFFAISWNQTICTVLSAMMLWAAVIAAIVLSEPALVA